VGYLELQSANGAIVLKWNANGCYSEKSEFADGINANGQYADYLLFSASLLVCSQSHRLFIVIDAEHAVSKDLI